MSPSSAKKCRGHLRLSPCPPWLGQDLVSASQLSSDTTCGDTGGNGVRTGKEDKLFSKSYVT